MLDNQNFKKLKRHEQAAIIEETYGRAIEIEKRLIQLESAFKEKIENLNSSINLEDLKEKQETINSICSEVTVIKEDITSSQTDIDEFYWKLFDPEGSEKTGIEFKVNNLKNEFEKLLYDSKIKSEATTVDFSKKLDDLAKTSSEKTQKVFKDIEAERKNILDKIESLLPSATSVGLASSYKEAQDNIKSIPYLWVGFTVVLLALFGWYAYAYFLASKGAEILAHILAGSPLIWMAWHLQRTISQKSQILEEYNHKQRVMHLYEGFVRAIHESGSKDQKIQLLSIMLETVKSNPAKILSDHKTLFETILAKVPLPFTKEKLINKALDSMDNQKASA